MEAITAPKRRKAPCAALAAALLAAVLLVLPACSPKSEDTLDPDAVVDVTPSPSPEATPSPALTLEDGSATLETEDVVLELSAA